MTRLAACCLVLTLGAGLASAGKPRVRRASLAAVEKSMDRKIEQTSLDIPVMLLGNARGIYLDGYGAVFTQEINLVASAPISPFKQTITKEEIARLHAKKLERLPWMRDRLREMLLAAAASLDEVPPGEQIVLAISLFAFSWEDSSGLPSQMVMQAAKGKLIDYQTGKIDRPALDAAVTVQEF